MTKETKLLWHYAAIAVFAILACSAYSLYAITMEEVYLYLIAIFIFIAFAFIIRATWLVLQIEKYGTGYWDSR